MTKRKIIKNLIVFCSALMVQSPMTAQNPNTINFSFDNENTDYLKVDKGNADIMSVGSYNGNALRLKPNSAISIKSNIKPSSTYVLTAWMKTESGADNMSMSIEGLGNNNIDITTALATWTKFERKINVPSNTSSIEIRVNLGQTNGTCAWVDEISLVRTGDYKEEVYDGIPEMPKREIKTELDLSMQPDEKIQWMRDARIGMFIHWGLYAGPGVGEWYMENKGVSIEEYRKLAYPESGEWYFDAKNFNPKKWAELAKKAGTKYVCLTTQHHDGYALFDSHYMNAFTSKQTHNRDFVKEYVDACREEGLRIGLYKTLINWRYPGYYDIYGNDCKPNKFGYTTATWHKENARQMKEELYCTVKELVTNYGKIDMIFWDGGWISQQGSDADGAPFWESGKYMNADNEWKIDSMFIDREESTGKPLGIMGIVRKYQPDIVTNPRTGWIGDYTCEEGGGEVRGSIRKGVVEKCFSLTPGWGYNRNADESGNIKSLKEIKRLCSDCMVRDMVTLINVGPDRHGDIPQKVVDRLNEFGEWTNKVGEAIYGTRGGPWQPVDGKYGFTHKDNTVYIYFLGGYTSDIFQMPAVDKGIKAKDAYVVGTNQKVKLKQKGNYITLSEISPEKDDITIIAIKFNKPISKTTE